jgi:hypothetical protein
VWQKDDPSISFRSWIALGKYVPTIIQNADYFDELEALTKEIQMKLESIFTNIEEDDGNSDYDDEDEDEDDDDSDENIDNEDGGN